MAKRKKARKKSAARKTVVRRSRPRKAKAKARGKFVYFFGEGKADGHGAMKDLLGGKGAGLAEMTNAGLPVPPGFTVSTSACRQYFDNRARLSSQVKKQFEKAVAHLEKVSGRKLGSKDKPLLVSVRSGAKFSMPGMMDTILNLGLNDETTEALAGEAGSRRFALDCYRRFIQMFGNVVLEIGKDEFDHIFEQAKERAGARLDTDLSADALGSIVQGYKALVRKRTGKAFPQQPRTQLSMARDAVFRSWNNPRARSYRRMHKISEALGTAVNPVHGRKGILRRVPAQRPGRGRCGRHPHPPAGGGVGPTDAQGLQTAQGLHLSSGTPLPGHAGLRVHHPGRHALHAPDPHR
jgi:pyruvate,orthophosphate dikinase